MRSYEERTSMLSTIFTTARRIAQHDPFCPAGRSAWEYLQFCIRHGCIGEPTNSPNKFSLSGYLRPGRIGNPNTPEERKQTLGIIVCFSDEVMPCNPMQKTTADGVTVEVSGYVLVNHHVLVIGNADWYAPMDLALKLLHEARHARHYFGKQFERLEKLDPEEFHESRTWKYEFDLLDACGGNLWQKTVEKELALVAKRYTQRQRSPGEKYFAMSGNTYPELNSLFGIPGKSDTEYKRNILVAMRANFLLAERANLPNLNAAYANIVGSYYKWAHEQK